MSAIIIKFPRTARFRTKAAQVRLNRVFKRIKAGEPDLPDRKAFNLAVLFFRLEERSAQLHREKGTTAPAMGLEAMTAAATSSLRAVKAATARRRA